MDRGGRHMRDRPCRASRRACPAPQGRSRLDGLSGAFARRQPVRGLQAHSRRPVPCDTSPTRREFPRRPLMPVLPTSWTLTRKPFASKCATHSLQQPQLGLFHTSTSGPSALATAGLAATATANVAHAVTTRRRLGFMRCARRSRRPCRPCSDQQSGKRTRTRRTG